MPFDEWNNARMFDIDQQQILFRELVEELSTQAPLGWATMNLVFIAAGRSLQYEIELDIDVFPEVYPDAKVMALREAMYRPGRGTWFTMHLTLTALGEVATTFDYEERPHGPSLGWALEDDLQLYPRDTIPDWIAEALAELADLHTRATDTLTNAHADASTPPPLPRHDTSSPEFQAALKAFHPEEPDMVYAKISRRQHSDHAPAVAFVEVDADGTENRRVELFPDGSAETASLYFDGE